MAGAIVSALRRAIQRTPDDFAMDAKSVPNYLRRQGVKDEELDWAQLNLPESGRVTREDLVRAEQNRADNFGSVEAEGPEGPSTGYRYYSLEAGRDNPTYRENIRTFGDAPQMSPDEALQADPTNVRYESEHFPGVKNYLYHTRTFETQIGGQPTRVVQEIQSDLHQQGRQVGYVADLNTADELIGSLTFAAQASGRADVYAATENLLRLSDSEMSALGRNPDMFRAQIDSALGNDTPRLREFLNEVAADMDEVFSDGGMVPRSPMEKTWLRRAIEEQAVEASNVGDTQIAIPISGREVRGNLHRAPGVQRWYETQVTNTAKKVAKSIGGEFELVTQPFIARNVNQIAQELTGRNFDELQQMQSQWADLDARFTTALRDNDRQAVQELLGQMEEIDQTVNEMFGVIDGGVSLRGQLNSIETAAEQEAFRARGPGSETTYAMIRLPRDEQGNLRNFETPLYSSAAATLIGGRIAYEQLEPQAQQFVDQAREQGLGEEQIAAYLETQGIGAEDREAAQRAEFREQAAAMGMSETQIDRYMNERAIEGLQPEMLARPDEDFTWQSTIPHVPDDTPVGEVGDVSFPTVELPFDEVRQLALETGADPTTREGMNTIYSEAERRRHPQQLSGQQVAGRLARLHALTKPYDDFERPLSWMRAQFGENAEYEYNRRREESVQHILNLAAERGLELQYREGNFFAQDAEGNLQHVTPSFLQEMGRAKYEITGGVIGGLAPWLIPATRNLGAAGPWGRAAQVAIGGTLATAGAVTGGQIDYLMAGIEEHEDWEASVALERAMSSVEMSIVGEVVGYGVFKAGALGLRQMRHAYEFARNGNIEGAYRSMKESAGGLTDEQVDEIIGRWERLNNVELSGSRARQALQVLPETGVAEKAAAAALRYSPVAGNRISARVNQRAEQLRSAIQRAETPELSRRVLDDLNTYERDVKTLFDTVKRQGTDLAPEGYRFEIPELAIRPLLEHQVNTTTDPAVANRFMRVLENVDALTTNRSFDDLMELRQVVNGLRYNRTIKSAHDHEALNNVLGSINGEINRVMHEVDGGAEWLRAYRDANSKYSEYKGFLDNEIFRGVMRGQSFSPEKIAKEFIQHGRALDDTYSSFISKLSPEVRDGVEVSIIEQLTSSATYGADAGLKAIDFVGLSSKLREFDFRPNSQAAQLRRAIDEFAEVYRNDPRIGFESGNIQIPRFQSYLTTDPVVRAKFELASHVFNRLRSLRASSTADSIALVQRTAKLLENPLNARNVNDILGELRENPQLMELYERFQQESLRHRSSEVPRAQLHRDSSGRYFMQPGDNRSLTNEAIPTHRLVGEDEVREQLGLRKINSRTLTREKKMKLMDQGYSTIVFDDGQVIKLY